MSLGVSSITKSLSVFASPPSYSSLTEPPLEPMHWLEQTVPNMKTSVSTPFQWRRCRLTQSTWLFQSKQSVCELILMSHTKHTEHFTLRPGLHLIIQQVTFSQSHLQHRYTFLWSTQGDRTRGLGTVSTLLSQRLYQLSSRFTPVFSDWVTCGFWDTGLKPLKRVFSEHHRMLRKHQSGNINQQRWVATRQAFSWPIDTSLNKRSFFLPTWMIFPSFQLFL